MRRQDDWDDALDEARNNAIARGETKPLEPFVPGPDFDYGMTLTITLREELWVRPRWWRSEEAWKH